MYKKKTYIVSLVATLLDHFIQLAIKDSTSDEAKKVRAESAATTASMNSKTAYARGKKHGLALDKRAADTKAAVSSFKPDPNKTDEDNDLVFNQMKEQAQDAFDKKFRANRTTAVEIVAEVDNFQYNPEISKEANEDDLNKKKRLLQVKKEQQENHRIRMRKKYQEDNKIGNVTREDLCKLSAGVLRSYKIVKWLSFSSSFDNVLLFFSALAR